jgi:4-hydroxybenzoate polyprenyltransferase
MRQQVVETVPLISPSTGQKHQTTLHLLIAAMRPHQWLKNLLVLIPLVFGKKLGDPAAIGNALLACASFCFTASSLYIINDIIDAPSDRLHPEKCLRPIASGALSTRAALLGASALLFVAFCIASPLGPQFLFLAALYGGSTLGYCFALKKVAILDGMIIASGFVLRVVGGSTAAGLTPSHWLIVCTFLPTLYLAFAKRRQELLALSDSAGQHRQVLREYTAVYLEQANNILIGATMVCYVLYTVAPETVARFGTDSLIYGAFFVIYGLLRYMILSQDPSNCGDPCKLLISDKPLLISILLWTTYNTIIIYRIRPFFF